MSVHDFNPAAVRRLMCIKIHMSTLYLGSDPRSLADKLAEQLDQHGKTGDIFAPTTIVVPNRYLRKWLRLYLARTLGVAINLDFQTLEAALWNLLKELDPDSRVTPPETIDENIYRLMMLSVLLTEKDPHLEPLQSYLQIEGQSLSRLSCRRAWFLADRLGVMIRDYEYARQDVLIQNWLRQQLGLGSASEFHKMMERAQRALFLHITSEPDGKRARLNGKEGKQFKTFPQYAMERMTLGEPSDSPGRLRDSARQDQRTIHFFGFTQICELHARTIAWLGKSYDLRFYHLNVLANELDESVKEKPGDASELLRLWGHAGKESWELLKPWPFARETLPVYATPKRRGSTTVLARMRDQLLGAAPAKSRLAQDTSLQIVGCPGIAREVETVYDSIVHNLNDDPTLRQTDVAVLVTDMSKYRATLQAVFERPPRRLQYNLVDYNAAGTSMFGQALLGMLDLTLESFSRSRVFGVILNPCFLARLGVDRGQAATWAEWAESLGIYQGWDADEKHHQGYPRSPLYAWRLGLQRLRLGRFMDVGDEEAAEPARRFGHVIPFADLASTEREQLDAFCRAVEGLLPTLARLRTSNMSGARWASALHRLVQEFLEVPADRPEEEQVRDEVLAAFETLGTWDALHDAKQKAPGLPLALVREYLQSQLEVLPGNRGDYLVGGVTIAALEPMRPVPFAIVYLLGLGEDLFPGSNTLSSFDLRGAQRMPGDIRAAEQHLYDFLATILSAQQKLYLLYNNHNLQKDQPLLPALPLLQMQRYLNQNVVASEFQPITAPVHADDARFLDLTQQPPYQDVLVQTRPADRCLALSAAERDNRLTLAGAQQAEWADRRREFQIDFSIAPDSSEAATQAVTVTLTELKRFLYLPAEGSLRRHLHIEAEDEETMEDDEPLVTSRKGSQSLIRQTLHHLIQAAVKGDAQQALANWKEQFHASYADARLRCRVPEEAFGEIDQASVRDELQERIHGQGQMESFLRERAGMTFCGPVLLGESLTPMGARLRFPVLTFRLSLAGTDRDIRLVGWTNVAWQSPGRLEILIVSAGKELDARQIHSSMLEPALLHLALLANAEPNGDGMSSQRWLAQREVTLHVAHSGGIATWTHPAGSITPTEAMAYLMELTRDFLDPSQFDLLPLAILSGSKQLQLAFHSDADFQITSEDYLDCLEDAVADARENTFGGSKIPQLVEMTKARIPADALAKVQRRFRLLDRGPARLRQQPKVSNVKRKSTKKK
ncbi:MAG: hypothetical protein EXR98_05970 [Gemmataceae bacterium]|nr:hypothetical protein [Gemmataceae bacterium]